MKIIEAIKNNQELELYNLSPETIVELIGFETIADDQVEDLQYYINKAHDEMEALIAEAKAEFGY